MKLEVKSVSVWTAVKIGFFLNLIMGFIMGLILALFLTPLMAVMSAFMPPSAYGGAEFSEMPVGFLLIILPIGYALFGAVFGTITFAVGAGVYNLVARILGGLELTYGVVEWGELAGGPPPPSAFPRYPTAPGPPHTAAYPPYAGQPGPFPGPRMSPPPPSEPPPEARPAEPRYPEQPGRDDQSNETDKPL